MIIDFALTSNLDNFAHCCICGKENDVFASLQYRCYDCKVYIEVREDNKVSQIWIGWDIDVDRAAVYYSKLVIQPFFLTITKDYIVVFSFGDEVKRLPTPETIDIKKLYNNVDTYKLLI
jgi:hypothetical protein